jgi:hypothetical protein
MRVESDFSMIIKKSRGIEISGSIFCHFFNLTYHYLAASLFFTTVKITETIISTKLAQQGTHKNSSSEQNVDQQNSKQQRLCC